MKLAARPHYCTPLRSHFLCRSLISATARFMQGFVAGRKDAQGQCVCPIDFGGKPVAHAGIPKINFVSARKINKLIKLDLDQFSDRFASRV
ncbi:MAG TPA: hypothetical protein VEG37_07610 [Burkholderiales bacterium]|nr:hypothetical protein [Burkholderiales bacterium]